MKNKKILQIDWEEVISIECDKCKVVYEKDNWAEFQEILSIKFEAGFEAGFGTVFQEGKTYFCDLCQNCVNELLGNYIRCVDC